MQHPGVINILDDYQYTQFHITASFIKSDAMRLTLFDPKMKYGEDAVYVIEQILDKHKYGVVSEPTHYYRKRADNSSAVQTKEKALDWYKITPQRFYKKLIDISIQKWGTRFLLCSMRYVMICSGGSTTEYIWFWMKMSRKYISEKYEIFLNTAKMISS